MLIFEPVLSVVSACVMGTLKISAAIVCYVGGTIIA